MSMISLGLLLSSRFVSFLSRNNSPFLSRNWTYLHFNHFFREESSGTPGYCTLHRRLIPAFIAWHPRDPFRQVLILRKERQEGFVRLNQIVRSVFWLFCRTGQEVSAILP